MRRVPPRPEDNEELVKSVFVRALLFVAIIVLVSVVATILSDALNPAKALPATLRLSFTVPDRYADNGAHCGLPDSAFVDSTGALLLGSPMSTVRYIKLYGYLFTNPTPALLDSVDVTGLGGQRVTIDVEVLEGTMGFLYVTAVNEGLESCGVGGYTFAVPAVDPSVAAALKPYYELVVIKKK